MMTALDYFKIMESGHRAADGWFFVPTGAGSWGAVHENHPCTHQGCPQAHERHFHRPTAHQREEMDRAISRGNRVFMTRTLWNRPTQSIQ